MANYCLKEGIGASRDRTAVQPDEMRALLHVGFSRNKSRPQVQQRPFSSRSLGS